MTSPYPIVAIAGILLVVLSLSAMLIWVERRLLALWQDRYGPNRVGPFAAELRLWTYGLPSRKTILAMAARRVKPGHAYPVALLNDRYARSDGADHSDSLMAGHKRECWLHRPVAMRRMEIGVAHAASLGLHQNLPRTGRGDVHFSKRQRFAELLDD